MKTLYITGAGISAESGIPTFRGKDGYWSIGSKNYTPQEMATRHMYQTNPAEFLRWYYQRFATYRNHEPNEVHYWLADKNLITQNIDGLDGKAGNKDYIAIHGRLDQMTLFHNDGGNVDVMQTPWDLVDNSDLNTSLMELFRINVQPEINVSYKPFILLFDEHYTDMYRINEAQKKMQEADKIIFMGTSFSVNITQIALRIATSRNIPIEVIDPNPLELFYENVTYHTMNASQYINEQH